MTYEYVCMACGHEWELEQRISAEPVKKCPACRKRAAKRQISGGAGFILKGGGWYADGYVSSGNGKGKSNGSAGAAKPAESEKPASSTKPEKSAPKSTGGAAKQSAA
jgi:putative FmdB family regulatory protein